jgi:hypothetical protein
LWHSDAVDGVLIIAFVETLNNKRTLLLLFNNWEGKLREKVHGFTPQATRALRGVNRWGSCVPRSLRRHVEDGTEGKKSEETVAAESFEIDMQEQIV